MSRTFVEALKEKYCEDDCENEDNFVVDIVFSNRPRTSGSSDDVELGYLTNMVLNRTSIATAGIPSDGLSSLCPNVKDLDLSFNSISDWNEVLSIFHHLPVLEFVNLSGNPLGGADQQVSTLGADQTFGIKNLVLNSTQVTWDQAVALGACLPTLQELHLCNNGYKDVSASFDKLCESLPVLQCLRLNGNNISRWADVIKIGYLPELHTLILSDNPLINISPVVTSSSCTNSTSSVQGSSQSDLRCTEEAAATSVKKDDDTVFLEENKTQEQREGNLDEMCTSGSGSGKKECCDNSAMGDNVQLAVGTVSEASESKDDDIDMKEEQHEIEGEDVIFQALSVLCVSNTQLCSWNDIEALRTFPKLTSLKIKDIPLEKDSSEEDRRRLFIASLPNVDILNGSEITSAETDKSERHYVRFFSDKPDPPKRYKELVEKYGELKSFSTVDIGYNFTEYAHLSFIYGGRCIHKEKIHVTEQVGILRKKCSQLVRKSPIFLKIYHLPKNRQAYGGDHRPDLQELVLETLPMSRYDMLDGDEIHIDVLSRPQPRGAALLLKHGPVSSR